MSFEGRMFSPQRKAMSFGGGKTTSFLGSPPPPPPPPVGSLSETVSLVESEAMGEIDDWRRFKEAGFLDEAAMVRKDHDALIHKVSKLETQLFDYQYNMGILLVEKEDWTLKFEELKQALSESHEILKREQTANLIALNEADNREENLRKALVAEKQCVVELEKALRETVEERVKVKRSSDSTMAEANALLVGAEEKSMELERKLRAAEARLAEVNRKSASLNMRLEELEARERVLQNEHKTLRAEREAHKMGFDRQQEHFREWERKLHDKETSLYKDRRNLDEREEKTTENERVVSQKEIELRELQHETDLSELDLKQKKDNINKQLEDLLSKEKESESLRISLVKKGQELRIREEKISARENTEVKQLLTEHKANLEMKMREFDLELEEKRNSLEKELQYKADDIRKKEAEINHREEILGRREQAMHEKSERLKEKNKEADDKSKAIKEKEKIVRAEERKLESEKKQLVSDRESLQDLLAEVERIKAESVELEWKIGEGREALRITNKERSEHVCLQSELKHEIEKYRHQKELLLDETRELKHEKENFEKQWEDLEEQRSKVNAELQGIADERETLEKQRRSEEEGLREERVSAQEFLRRELENLEAERDSFGVRMKAERLALEENARLEHSRMVHEFELRRRNLETEMSNQREKMDELLYKRRSALEDERERELDNIKQLKETAEKEMEEIRIERLKVENKREELASDNERLKSDRIEIRNDVDQLGLLSKKIKDQREELVRERARFLTFVEKLKSCNDGEEVAREIALSGFCSIPDVNQDYDDGVPMPSLAEENVERSASVSWLRKCASRILKLSPSKRSELDRVNVESSSLLASESEKEPTLLDVDGAGGPSATEHRSLAPLVKCSGPAKAQTVRFDSAEEEVDDHSQLESKADEVPENSLQSKSKGGRGERSRRQTSRIHRTRSVQAVVREAENFLGKTTLPKEAVNESRSDSLRAGTKRQRGQASDSETCSASVNTAGGGRRRKRQQTIALGSGETRYDLRSGKNVSTVDVLFEPKKTTSTRDEEEEESVSRSSSEVATRKSGETKRLARVTSTKTVELSGNKIVRFITPEQDTDDDDVSAEKPVEAAEVNAGVNDLAEDVIEEAYESGSTIHESNREDDDDDDDNDLDDDEEDEEDLQPGESSIGKKIWTFFTT